MHRYFVYFISFYATAKEGRSPAWGNGAVTLNCEITSMGHVKQITKFLEGEANLKELIVMNYQLLREEADPGTTPVLHLVSNDSDKS